MSTNAESELISNQRKVQKRRIARFPTLVKRWDLFPFRKIADWCARKDGSVERVEANRARTYLDLEQSILDGEFGPPEKPFVVYLPRLPYAPVGQFPLRFHASHIVRLEGYGFTADLWARREDVERWLAVRQIPAPPIMIYSTASEKAAHPKDQLKSAPDAEVRRAITAAYNKAEATGEKPPNIKELHKHVVPLLESKGYSASDRSVQKIGEEHQFKSRRLPPGKTLKSRGK